MEAPCHFSKRSFDSNESVQYRLKIAMKDLETYKDKVAELERQLTHYKTQVELLTRDKALLEQHLTESQTLLATAKSERDEAIGEKFALITEVNERSTVASCNPRCSQSPDTASRVEEQLFRARAEVCQLRADLEDCTYERNEARRLLKVDA